MNKRIALLLLTVVTSLCLVGFFGKPKNAIATIGKEVITKNDLDNRVNAYPEQQRKLIQEQNKTEDVLNQMIDETLLYVDAKKQGYEKNEEYKKLIKDTKRQVLIGLLVKDKVDNRVNVTEDDLKTYYNENQNQFKEYERRNVRHILVKEQAEAKKILRGLKKGKDFSKLAEKKSIDPTSKNGGLIGWFTRGQLVPEFEEAAFNLKKVGSLSKVVKTQFGYHVIKLEDKEVRPGLTFDQVKGQIQQVVTMQKKQDLTKKLVDDLKTKYKITKNLNSLEAKASTEAAK